ncbi:NAM domain-containing protein [Cephalotus follicularis]|uniref:NAM domain-containing protein n=1 Tax=Cephalotus follicularis TaxID=3775 RepID=A0A1Q3ANH1_CEPFO|nr:NAM domain-containing protein [Cephalotus follicularis]
MGEDYNHHQHAIVVYNNGDGNDGYNDNMVVSSSDSDSNYGNDEYFKSFPEGYRFRPSDKELIVHYLKNKIEGAPLPPNRIHVIDLSLYSPQVLTERFKLLLGRETEWYFLTRRKTRYRNGKRPDRRVGNGYWKSTGIDKDIKNGNQRIGHKRSLDFNEGKHSNGKRTEWKMHEYRLDEKILSPTYQRSRDDSKLGDWVLCKIYKKCDKKNDENNEDTENPNNNEDTENPNNEEGSSVDHASQTRDINSTAIVDGNFSGFDSLAFNNTLVNEVHSAAFNHTHPNDVFLQQENSNYSMGYISDGAFSNYVMSSAISHNQFTSTESQTMAPDLWVAVVESTNVQPMHATYDNYTIEPSNNDDLYDLVSRSVKRGSQ